MPYNRRLAVALTGLLAGLVATAPGIVAAQDAAELFGISCAACHNEGGAGNPGLAPPINRPAFWQAMGDEGPAYIAGVMVSGMAGPLQVDGQDYVGLMMPPMAAIPDEDLVAVGTYVLQTLGDTRQELTPEILAAAQDPKPTHADLRAMRPE